MGALGSPYLMLERKLREKCTSPPQKFIYSIDLGLDYPFNMGLVQIEHQRRLAVLYGRALRHDSSRIRAW